MECQNLSIFKWIRISCHFIIHFRFMVRFSLPFRERYLLRVVFNFGFKFPDTNIRLTLRRWFNAIWVQSHRFRIIFVCGCGKNHPSGQIRMPKQMLFCCRYCAISQDTKSKQSSAKSVTFLRIDMCCVS